MSLSTTKALRYNAQIEDKPKGDFTWRTPSKECFAPRHCLSLHALVVSSPTGNYHVRDTSPQVLIDSPFPCWRRSTWNKEFEPSPEANRGLVPDQFAALIHYRPAAEVGGDGRAAAESCALLLAIVGGEPSCAAHVENHAAADGAFPPAARWVWQAGETNLDDEES